jgi:hypothetical protein
MQILETQTTMLLSPAQSFPQQPMHLAVLVLFSPPELATQIITEFW